MRLSSTTCVVRPFQAGDASSLAAHANDREIWLNLRDRFPHPYSVRDAEEYISMVAARPELSNFGIVMDGKVVGSIGLMLGQDIERKSAELGYWLGRAFWGRGITTDAVRAVTLYGFDELGLHRIFALPFVRNPASMRVLEKAGYVQEGIMRRSALKDGEILDQALFAAYDDDLSGGD